MKQTYKGFEIQEDGAVTIGSYKLTKAEKEFVKLSPSKQIHWAREEIKQYQKLIKMLKKVVKGGEIK